MSKRLFDHDFVETCNQGFESYLKSGRYPGYFVFEIKHPFKVTIHYPKDFIIIDIGGGDTLELPRHQLEHQGSTMSFVTVKQPVEKNSPELQRFIHWIEGGGTEHVKVEQPNFITYFFDTDYSLQDISHLLPDLFLFISRVMQKHSNEVSNMLSSMPDKKTTTMVQ